MMKWKGLRKEEIRQISIVLEKLLMGDTSWETKSYMRK